MREFSKVSSKKEEEKSLGLLHEIAQGTMLHLENSALGRFVGLNGKYHCFGLTLQKIYVGAGKSSLDSEYTHKIMKGFGYLVGLEMRNKSNGLNMNKPRLELMKQECVLFHSNNNNKQTLILKSISSKLEVVCPDVHDSVYNLYVFHSFECCGVQDNEINCVNCEKLHKYLRRKCYERAVNQENDYVPGRRSDFTASSPSNLIKFNNYEKQMKNKNKCITRYLKKNHNEIIDNKGNKQA